MTHRILVLPGFACTSQIWGPAKDSLASSRQFTLVDWPISLTPTFHRIDDFSGWLSGQFPIEAFDIIIGHSLGGLVAACLLTKNRIRHINLILVESFLLPPQPFFQNLLMPDTDPQVGQTVKEMLSTHRAFYSSTLQQALRTVDLSACLGRTEFPLHAVYGDRGQPDRAIGELNWTPDLCARIPVTLIPNACHFPMLENPGAMRDLLDRLIA